MNGANQREIIDGPTDFPVVEVEKAYRESYQESAKHAASWHIPMPAEIEAACNEREVVQDADNEVELARARARVQSLSAVSWALESLLDIGFELHKIKHEYISPWLEHVNSWAAGDCSSCEPPPEPLYQERLDKLQRPA